MRQGCSPVKGNDPKAQKAGQVLASVVDLSLVGFAGSLSVSIAMTQISLGIGWIAWLAKCLVDKKWNGHRTSLDVWFLALLGAGLLSSAFSIHPLASMVSLKKFYLASAVYLVGFNIRTKDRINELMNLFLGMTALTGVYGLVMFLFGFQQRLLGAQGMAMTSAGIYMMAGLISLQRWKSSGHSPLGSMRPMMVLASLVLLSSVVFTRTVSSFLGLLGGLATAAKRTVRLMMVGAMVILSVAVYFSVHNYELSMKLYSGNKITSWNIRWALWEIGWELIKERPLTGYGLIDFGQLIQSRKNTKQLGVLADCIATGHFHNNLIHITASTGLVGLAAFIGLWTAILIFLIKSIKASAGDDRLLAKGVLSAITGFLLMGLLEWNFGDSEVITVVWFLVGLAVSFSRLRQRSDAI